MTIFLVAAAAWIACGIAARGLYVAHFWRAFPELHREPSPSLLALHPSVAKHTGRAGANNINREGWFWALFGPFGLVTALIANGTRDGWLWRAEP